MFFFRIKAKFTEGHKNIKEKGVAYSIKIVQVDESFAGEKPCGRNGRVALVSCTKNAD